MKTRIDGYLSNKIQSAFPAALVKVTTGEGGESWFIDKQDGSEPLEIGENFGRAKQAITAILRAEREKKK